MTDKEKAKAYDEALERARKMLNMILDNELLGFPDQIREIFPQLKESKDEKIREEMIRYFTEMKKGGSASLPYDDCITYLERRNEQKPAEWSEEDEKMRNALWNLLKIQYAQDYSMTGVGIEAGKFRDWLKSLRPQPKEEWSEEDEDMLNSCISSIEEAKENRYAYKETDGDTSYDHEIAWLESLRNRVGKEFLQPHWKPSEEQMKALKEAYESYDFCDGERGALESLYNYIKKL